MTSRVVRSLFLSGLFVVLLASAFVGCSPAQKAIKSGNIEQAYNMAIDYYKQERWSKASQLFETVSIYYIGTQREDSILYYNARSKYKSGEYDVAISLLEDYRRTYGRSTVLEEVEGMYTLSHYYLSPGPTRDQTMTQLTINKIDEFCSRYPNSENYDYFVDMRAELMGRLYYKDYINAYTYYKIGRYRSAITSLRNALRRYPETTHREEIIFHILASNFELAENSITARQHERYITTMDSYYTFVAEFPESIYSSRAERMFNISKRHVERGEAERDEI